MSFSQSLNQITAGKLNALYFLTGAEAYLLKRAEKALIQAVFPDGDSSGLTVFHGDPGLKELIVAIETIPFFGDKNLIIVKETALFQSSRKAEQEETENEDAPRVKNSPLERLISLFGNMPPYSHAVFTSGEKPDKRRKIYKAMEKHGVIIEAAPLKGRELREWLFEKLAELNVKLAADAKEHLLFVVNMMPHASLDFLHNEIEKISLYTRDGSANPVVTLPKLRELLSKAPEISIFAMVEALRQKELPLALELLEEQFRVGKHPVQILALLAKQAGQLLQAKELLAKGYDAKQIAAHFKLPLFIGEKVARQSRHFSRDALTRATVEMAAADYLLKSGRSGPYALEKIMIEMCGD